jgi:CUE domain
MTASNSSEAAVLGQLKQIFPHHSSSLLRNAATQHNFDLELTIANLLAADTHEQKPLQVGLLTVECAPQPAASVDGVSRAPHCHRCRNCSSLEIGCERASQKYGREAGTLSRSSSSQGAHLAQACPFSRSIQHSMQGRRRTTAGSSPAWVVAAAAEYGHRPGRPSMTAPCQQGPRPTAVAATALTSDHILPWTTQAGKISRAHQLQRQRAAQLTAMPPHSATISPGCWARATRRSGRMPPRSSSGSGSRPPS